MRSPLIPLALATILGGLSPDRALADEPARTARLEAVIERALAERRIVGTVVLVAHDGRVVFHRAAGLADREAGRPMHEDTIFRLASLSKPMVSAALMRLVEQGRLTLDDPVTRWLPAFRPRLADGSMPTLSLRQLLNHTSGLGYRFEEVADGPYHRLQISDGMDQPDLTLAENLRRLAEAPLAFAPGTGWRYSLGLDVLGAVIEAATGEPLAAVVRHTVTGPLGLGDTGFVASDPARLAVPYADARPEPVRMSDGISVPLWDGAVVFAPSRALTAAAYASGGAGMVGTAGEFLRFLESLRQGGQPILAPATVALMMRDQVGPAAATQGPGWGFGFGWAVLDDPAAAATPQAQGTIQWGGAYGHSWFVDPARALSVVVLTNTAFEGMSGAFPREIRNAVYGAAGDH